MSIRTASGRNGLIGAAMAGLLVAMTAGGCGGDSGVDANQGVPECQRDESEGPDTAVDVTVGQQIEGYLCPKEDEDWYRVELSPDTGLLEVNLAMTSTITPVEPTYSVWSMDESGEPIEAVTGADPNSIGGPLDEVHCIAPDSYYLVVRDYGDNAQDLRHAYNLTVTTAVEPDAANEPNNTLEQAINLTSGESVQGYVACAGDQDWYKINVPPGELLRVRLEADVSGFEPGFRLLDASEELVVENWNLRGKLEATDIDTYRVLPGSGDYYVVVGDDDGVDADPNVQYTLTVDSVNDPDPNEPNNHPTEATPLAGSAVGCGGSWGSWMTKTGTIGSPGDNDWFVLPLTGCSNGILEAELTMDYSGLSDEEEWNFQDEVQASVAMVRRHTASACSEDESCSTLQLPCSDEWDCSGYYNNCLSDGLCAGATVCLDGDVCGANQTERHYDELNIPGTITQPPPANVARFAAPIFGDNVVYLRVSDFQSNGGDPSRGYTLRVRVRSDPDGAEIDNIYNTNLYQHPTGDTIVQTRIDSAVRNMSTSGCNWVTARVSYQNDVDWIKFDHPCPGNSCNLELRWQAASGDVTPVIHVYHRSSLQLDFKVDAGSSGWYGSTTAIHSDATCFYAYENHSGPYYIAVRDWQEDGNNWDPDETIQICVLKVADSCEAPCVVYPESGCGPG